MRILGLSFLFLLFSGLLFSQENNPESEMPGFTYLDIKEEFNLLVDYSMVNPECADKGHNFYSIIIGTTVIDDTLERISVLIPCLGNEFIAGDLITIKPIKTPKKNIVYAVRTFTQDGVEYSELFGGEYRAIWGEVGEVL